jgi:hypothetical protein
MFSWTFSSVARDPPPGTLSSDTLINDELIAIEAMEQESAFESNLSDFFRTLYESGLPDFGISAELCKPADFDISRAVPLSANSPGSLVPPNLQLSSVGPTTCAFLSTLGFLERVRPASDTSHTTFSPASHYRHRIHVQCLASDPPPPHFMDFVSGLGFADGQTAAYWDCLHEVVFELTGAPERSVLIVWTDGLTQEQILGSYSQENLVRIEVSPKSSGLFWVRTKVIQGQAATVRHLAEVLVSKKALPLLVLSHVMMLRHIIDAQSKRIETPLHEASRILKALSAQFLACNVPPLPEKALFDGIKARK